MVTGAAQCDAAGRRVRNESRQTPFIAFLFLAVIAREGSKSFFGMGAPEISVAETVAFHLGTSAGSPR